MSGLCRRPGVPLRDWHCVGEEDLGRGGPYEVCQWCPYHQPIRHVRVMCHPNWPEEVRAGRDCADLMSGYAPPKHDREFRRGDVYYAAEMMGDPPQHDLDNWDDSEASLSANGTGTDRKRESIWNYAQRELDLSPRPDFWEFVFWVLVIRLWCFPAPLGG